MDIPKNYAYNDICFWSQMKLMIKKTPWNGEEKKSISFIQAWHETGSKCISFAGAKKKTWPLCSNHRIMWNFGLYVCSVENFAWIICQYNRNTSVIPERLYASYTTLWLCSLVEKYFHCNLSPPFFLLFIWVHLSVLHLSKANCLHMNDNIICSLCCWMRLCCDKENILGPECRSLSTTVDNYMHNQFFSCCYIGQCVPFYLFHFFGVFGISLSLCQSLFHTELMNSIEFWKEAPQKFISRIRQFISIYCCTSASTHSDMY